MKLVAFFKSKHSKNAQFVYADETEFQVIGDASVKERWFSVWKNDYEGSLNRAINEYSENSAFDIVKVDA